MTIKKLTLFLTALILAFSGCEQLDPDNGRDDVTEQPGDGGSEGEKPGDGEDNTGDTEGGATGLPVAGYPAGAFTVESLNDEGITYMWDESAIPEITIHMTVEEWNKLLARYDEFQHNVDYFHADFTYKKGNEEIFIEDGGVRLRGNTSRRRPEGNSGQVHNPAAPDWHHCHFGINFRKFHKDKDHTIKGIRKVNLKWFKDDPCYVRELYCYNLFRRYKVTVHTFKSVLISVLGTGRLLDYQLEFVRMDKILCTIGIYYRVTAVFTKLNSVRNGRATARNYGFPFRVIVFLVSFNN